MEEPDIFRVKNSGITGEVRHMYCILYTVYCSCTIIDTIIIIVVVVVVENTLGKRYSKVRCILSVLQ